MKKTIIKMEISLNDEEVEILKKELCEIKQAMEEAIKKGEVDDEEKSVLYDIILELSKKVEYNK